MKYIINLIKQTFRMTLNMHLRYTNQIHKDLKKITDILDNYQTSRGTQFNLTLFDVYIKTLYTSKRNQIYSEAFSTRFSAINLLYLRLPMKLLTDLHQIADISGPPTSRGTQCNWHLSIYISKHFSHLNAMKYIINLIKQTFRMTLNMHLRYTNQIHKDLKISQTF